MIYIKRQITWGNILVAIDQNIHIAGLWFEGQKYFPNIQENACFFENLTEKELEALLVSKSDLKDIYKLIDTFDQQMREYEAGNRQSFELPLSPVGSEFRQKVWKELLEIPFGETTTYGTIGKEIAKALGKWGMSAQAIGGAVGHNPISLIIPCHRVVGAKGQLTGYAGGVDKKTAILRHEGVKIKNSIVVD